MLRPKTKDQAQISAIRAENRRVTEIYCGVKIRYMRKQRGVECVAVPSCVMPIIEFSSAVLRGLLKRQRWALVRTLGDQQLL
jgi:hypothetical protein